MSRICHGIIIGILSTACVLALDGKTGANAQTVQPKSDAKSGATTSDERVELIMEGLPPAGTPEYKAVIRYAGDAKGQVLPLTKSEMWAVRRSRLAVLKAAAATKNVTVRELDQSWNEVFNSVAGTATMAADQSEARSSGVVGRAHHGNVSILAPGVIAF